MASNIRVEIVPPERIADPTFAGAWDRLRHRTELPTPFTTLAFARSTADSLGYQLQACVAKGDETEFAGGVLCFTRRLGPYSRAVVPPFVQYTPVLVARAATENEVHRGHSVLQEILSRIGATFGAAALNLLPEVCDLRPAVWAGFRARPLYTYRIAFQSGRDVQHTWSQNAQRLFRRFTDDYVLREGPEHAEDVIALCKAAYERHGRGLPVSAGRLERLVEALAKNGMVHIFALHARSEGVCEAGVIVLHDDSVAHYWIAGSRPGPAMTVLLGHVFEWATEAALRVFDFVGANTPSIAEFKRRFGPQLVSYHRIEHRRAVGLRVLDLVRGRGA